MFALEVIIDRLRTARLVVRGLALLKDLGPYAAIELLLPGGSLIALGLWLYSRHKAGKPLLPFRFAAVFKKPSIAGRLAALSRLAARKPAASAASGLPIAPVALGRCMHLA
jgi:hypothetical protein